MKRWIVLCVLLYSQYNFCQTLPSGSGLYIMTATGITVPGIYYLGKDIIGTVTIASDDVVLDLNGKSISGSPATTDRITISANHSNIVIRNGQIKNGSSSPASGIKINNGENIVVSDIVFDNNYLGVYATTSTNVTIESCIFEDHASQSAIKLQNCNTSNIVNNTIVRGTGANAYGIELDGSWNITIRENTIHNKIQGIRLSSSYDNLIEGNICNKNKVGIFLITDCTNNKIIGNMCNENSDTAANSGSGIYLHTRCNRNIIQHNECIGNSSTVDNGGAGIYLFCSTVANACLDNKLENNMCGGNSSTALDGGTGIHVVGAASTTTTIKRTVISENICQENSSSNQRGGSGIYILRNSDNILQNNACIGNSITNSNGGSGIYLNALASSGLVSNSIQNNSCVGNSTNVGTAALSNGGSGITLSSPNAINNVLSRNICVGNMAVVNDIGGAAQTGEGILLIAGAVKNVMAGNICSSNVGIKIGSGTLTNVGAGFFLSNSSDNVLEDNTSTNNVSVATSSGGICMVSTCDNNVVRKNICRENKIGILVTPSNSDNTIVSFNACDRNNTGISDSGTTSKIYYNDAINNGTNYSGVTFTKTQNDLLTTGSFGTNFSGT